MKITFPSNMTVCIGDSLMAKTTDADAQQIHSATIGVLPLQLLNINKNRPVFKPVSYPGKTAEYVVAQVSGIEAFQNMTNVLWVGTNNMSDLSGGTQAVLDAVADHVSRLTHRRFLVLPPMVDFFLQTGNEHNTHRAACSTALQSAYPDNFVDAWAALLAAGPAGDVDNGGSSVGTVHSSLRSDTLHLNNAGNHVVAALIDAELTARGW